jgi:hypothetical protein
MTPGDVRHLPTAQWAATAQEPVLAKDLGTGTDLDGDAHGIRDIDVFALRKTVASVRAIAHSTARPARPAFTS